MATRTRNDNIKRNRIVKFAVSALLALGIFCSIFAIRSCRWFVFPKDNESTEHRLFRHWSFLSVEALELTISVGIFSYQTFSTSQVYDDDVGSNTTIATTAGNEAYTATSNEGCVAYPEFWVGVDHPWKFTAQLCSVLAPTLAFSSWCVMIFGSDLRWVCIFFVMTTGIQAATVISSLSWCDQYWKCPWLLGSLVNLVAACLFLSCWALVVWGLVEIGTTPLKNTSKNSCANDQKKDGGQGCNNLGRVANGNNESMDVEKIHPFSVAVSEAKTTENGNGIEERTSGDADSKTPEDVECGQNTIPLRTCDQLSEESGLCIFESFSTDDDSIWSISAKEIYYDASFDEDTKGETNPVCHGESTLKEIRENEEIGCSSSDSDDETSSDDSSSTDSDE